MKILTNMDYIDIYANKLKKDNKLFNSQKILIESQINASKSLFNNMFKKDFKKQARDYLSRIKLVH